MTTRADIVQTVRGYLGTPFAHAQRVSGVGMDCAGVVVCCMRELGLAALDFDVPAYSQFSSVKFMREMCNRYLDPIEMPLAQPGDVLLLETQTDRHHIGVLGDYVHGGLSLIHAADNAHPPRVIETRMMFSRSSCLVAAYAFRGVA